MSIEVEAVYENGVLKLENPLPFQEHGLLVVTVKPKTSRVEASYGLIGWTGDRETLRKIAEDDEFGVLESP
jgi:predicted DNA-binding antitoxin AbrB/MazE fold protein